VLFLLSYLYITFPHLQSDALSAAGYTSRSTAQQQQQGVSSAVNATTALDQLTKSDPYGQTAGSGNAYQNAYQSSGAGKTASGYPTTAPGGYSSSTYANVQSSVASSYQQQGYGSYQPSSYQQQAGTGAQSGTGAVAGGGGAATQNIPVGGSSSQNSTRYARFLLVSFSFWPTPAERLIFSFKSTHLCLKRGYFILQNSIGLILFLYQSC